MPDRYARTAASKAAPGVPAELFTAAVYAAATALGVSCSASSWALFERPLSFVAGFPIRVGFPVLELLECATAARRTAAYNKW
jgi:hypothetical protein